MMFRAVWAARWYLILGLLTFTVVLVVNTPIHFIWQYAKPALGQLPVRIEQPVGTLWSGKARIQSPQSGILDTRWQLSPYSLLTGRADLYFHATGSSIRLEGHSEVVGLFSGKLQEFRVSEVDGYIDSSLIHPYLAQSRATLSGDFTISGLSADLSIETKKLNHLSGRLTYSGGQVEVPVQRERISADVPMLIANMQMEGDKAIVPVTTEDGEPLGKLFLQSDGWGGVSVLRRALDIVNQPWPDEQADADTVIFEVSQNIL